MACVGDFLETSARHGCETVALSCADWTFSWNRLLAAVRQLEVFLNANSPDGARIALLLSRPQDVLIAFFACARAGRVAMVMDAGWPASRIQNLLSATHPALLLDDDVFSALMIPQGHGVQLPGSGAAGKDGFPPETAEFYAGFTSGSTGLPKGFVRSHRSWLESFRLSEQDFEDTRPEQIVIPGGLSHSLHLYGAVHGLHRGTPVTVLPHFDPRKVLSVITAGRVALYATPTQLQLIAEAARRSGPVHVPLLVYASGAKWQDGARSAFAEVFPKAELVEFYGASETSFISFSRARETIPAGSVGRPASGVAVAIGDPHRPAPPGVCGAVWVKSPLLFSRYICGDAPETVWKDGWLSFGDHGLLDEAGFLYLTGRQNRMVITSGLNVYPEEVEAVLMSHPLVRLAAVLGVKDNLRGTRLEAVVELAEGADDAALVLSRHCREHLGPARSPRRFHLRSTIPLTAGGKPDLQRLGLELAGEQTSQVRKAPAIS